MFFRVRDCCGVLLDHPVFLYSQIPLSSNTQQHQWLPSGNKHSTRQAEATCRAHHCGYSPCWVPVLLTDFLHPSQSSSIVLSIPASVFLYNSTSTSLVLPTRPCFQMRPLDSASLVTVVSMPSMRSKVPYRRKHDWTQSNGSTNVIVPQLKCSMH
jgi:hypothetical protein